MALTCPDLRIIGRRFRPQNETYNRSAHSTDDCWELVLPGRSGFVAPFGGSLLMACTRSSGTTDKILASVPGARVHQDGADGQNIVFPADWLSTVADLLRLRCQRVLSAEQRRANAERLKSFRFVPSRKPRQSDAQKSKSKPRCDGKQSRAQRGRKRS
jgi:hypothetical protein